MHSYGKICKKSQTFQKEHFWRWSLSRLEAVSTTATSSTYSISPYLNSMKHRNTFGGRFFHLRFAHRGRNLFFHQRTDTTPVLRSTKEYFGKP
ncbi:hypothetical protein Y032_0037g3390 [Ancylostoma ceylanicum]|uniref:Uncharacterized protein n=1 Tax=Ancylostoma ceylanicum TaxID=53326 RepID=A0A016UJ43_9BILA|nr:hypothetical protein Y032_0037g3390 [Ancylostoma ceylanicum]